MKNKVIGVCPNCGNSVVEREKGWFCESNPCRFVLWKDNAFFKRLGKRIELYLSIFERFLTSATNLCRMFWWKKTPYNDKSHTQWAI